MNVKTCGFRLVACGLLVRNGPAPDSTGDLPSVIMAGIIEECGEGDYREPPRVGGKALGETHETDKGT